MPVLPPTLLSTCASSVVGICTNGSPRSAVAAANPARSPTTPPPSAITAVRRSTPASSSASTPAVGVQALGGLAGRHDDRARRRCRSRPALQQGRQVQRGHGLVGDDDGALLRQHRRQQRAGAGQQAVADHDVVARGPARPAAGAAAASRASASTTWRWCGPGCRRRSRRRGRPPRRSGGARAIRRRARRAGSPRCSSGRWLRPATRRTSVGSVQRSQTDARSRGWRRGSRGP